MNSPPILAGFWLEKFMEISGVAWEQTWKVSPAECEHSTNMFEGKVIDYETILRCVRACVCSSFVLRVYTIYCRYCLRRTATYNSPTKPNRIIGLPPFRKTSGHWHFLPSLWPGSTARHVWSFLSQVEPGFSRSFQDCWEAFHAGPIKMIRNLKWITRMLVDHLVSIGFYVNPWRFDYFLWPAKLRRPCVADSFVRCCCCWKFGLLWDYEMDAKYSISTHQYASILWIYVYN